MFFIYVLIYFARLIKFINGYHVISYTIDISKYAIIVIVIIFFSNSARDSLHILLPDFSSVIINYMSQNTKMSIFFLFQSNSICMFAYCTMFTNINRNILYIPPMFFFSDQQQCLTFFSTHQGVTETERQKGHRTEISTMFCGKFNQ